VGCFNSRDGDIFDARWEAQGTIVVFGQRSQGSALGCPKASQNGKYPLVMSN